MERVHQPKKVAVQTIAFACGFAFASTACGDDQMAASALSADAASASRDGGSASNEPRRRSEWIAADGGSAIVMDAGKATDQPRAAKRKTPPPGTSRPAAMDAAKPAVDAGTEADAGDDEDAGIDTPVRTQLISFKPMYSA